MIHDARENENREQARTKDATLETTANRQTTSRASDTSSI